VTAPALLERTVLDQQMVTARRTELGPWGVLSWLGPLLTLAATIAAGNLLVSAYAQRHTDGRGVVGVALTVGGELLLLAALVAFGHQVAARAGGGGPRWGWTGSGAATGCRGSPVSVSSSSAARWSVGWRTC
jgi:hypothetical protein